MLTALAHRLALVLPPMLAHRLAVGALALGVPVARRDLSGPAVTAAGVTFASPIGLAAGFDKDARALPGLVRMGFGHIEVGTVTPRPQAGNPGRVLFRLGEDRAIINRLGMPGDGAEAVAGRLERWRGANPGHPVRIGISVGANRDSRDIAADIGFGVARLGPLADYLAVNLSSPNTQGLRDWQSGERLSQVLDAAQAARAGLAGRRPLFVKLAADMDLAREADSVERAAAAGIDGLILCNTTLDRATTLRSPQADRPGGLSGAPLTARALAQLRRVHGLGRGRLVLVASGGVMTAADVLARLDAGASLVQLMTGWIYRGPRLLDEIAEALSEPMRGGAGAALRRSPPRRQPDPARP